MSSAPAPITVDASTWPLVSVTIRGAPSDRDWAAMFEGYQRCHERAAPFYLVVDAGGLKTVPDAAQRKLLAASAKAMADAARRWCVGTAVVVPNALLRGALTAINWLAPPPQPLDIVASLPEAVAAAHRALAARGISIPDGAERRAVNG